MRGNTIHIHRYYCRIWSVNWRGFIIEILLWWKVLRRIQMRSVHFSHLITLSCRHQGLLCLFFWVRSSVQIFHFQFRWLRKRNRKIIAFSNWIKTRLVFNLRITPDHKRHKQRESENVLWMKVLTFVHTLIRMIQKCLIFILIKVDRRVDITLMFFIAFILCFWKGYQLFEWIDMMFVIILIHTKLFVLFWHKTQTQISCNTSFSDISHIFKYEKTHFPLIKNINSYFILEVCVTFYWNSSMRKEIIYEFI
jgi:hypothetical protein